MPSPSAELPVLIRACAGGVWLEAEHLQEVRDPYRGDLVALAPRSTLHDLDRALDAAVRARPVIADMPPHERARLLRRIADRLEARVEGIALAMTRETGKPLADAMAEVARAAETLRLCAEEAVRIEGEHVPMDFSAAGSGKLAFFMRHPVGVVAAITPFNAPVHLAVHKLGPAIAAGNTVVIKPSPKAPLAFHRMIEVFLESGLPEGVVNSIYGDDVAEALVSDPRVDFVTFTGSTRVGKLIRARAGLKRVALELGGAAPTIVHLDADLEAAALACARNAMLLAGQSCVSVQNMLVHEAVRERFTEQLHAEVLRLRVGDPLDRNTEVGPLIDEPSARRVEALIGDALEQGAVRLCGGERRGALLDPVLLCNVSPSMSIVRDEIFGPAASVLGYCDIAEVFQDISDSPHGLQCGLFTRSLDVAMAASRRLRVGGIIVNGTSRWRSDQMPYGGVKDSGIGREGPRYAMRDMTEGRLLVFNV